MPRPLEKPIIQPLHFAFGVPVLSVAAVGLFAVAALYWNFIAGLCVFLAAHGVSIWVRSRHIHANSLILRALRKKRGSHDWSGTRRVYRG